MICSSCHILSSRIFFLNPITIKRFRRFVNLRTAKGVLTLLFDYLCLEINHIFCRFRGHDNHVWDDCIYPLVCHLPAMQVCGKQEYSF